MKYLKRNKVEDEILKMTNLPSRATCKALKDGTRDD